MYLQIELDKDDRKYHRFLFRQSQNEKPKIYKFNRIVFGVNSPPFSENFVSRENAMNFSDRYPRAVETIVESTSMDDSMDSLEKDEDAIRLYKELKTVWGGAGMNPRKWSSNSEKVLKSIEPEERKLKKRTKF